MPRSIAAASGRAIASPTTVTAITFSRSIVRTTSSASKRSVTVENTTDCPVVIAVMTAHCAAPCISGGRIISLDSGALRDAFGDVLVGVGELAGVEAPPAERRHEDVVLAPQHALRHARRAAGVEHVQIIGGRFDRRQLRRHPTPRSIRSRRHRAPGRCPSRRRSG